MDDAVTQSQRGGEKPVSPGSSRRILANSGRELSEHRRFELLDVLVGGGPVGDPCQSSGVLYVAVTWYAHMTTQSPSECRPRDCLANAARFARCRNGPRPPKRWLSTGLISFQGPPELQRGPFQFRHPRGPTRHPRSTNRRSNQERF